MPEPLDFVLNSKPRPDQVYLHCRKGKHAGAKLEPLLEFAVRSSVRHRGLVFTELFAASKRSDQANRIRIFLDRLNDRNDTSPCKHSALHLGVVVGETRQSEAFVMKHIRKFLPQGAGAEHYNRHSPAYAFQGIAEQGLKIGLPPFMLIEQINDLLDCVCHNDLSAIRFTGAPRSESKVG